jgi:SCP-2 sterol transfer family
VDDGAALGSAEWVEAYRRACADLPARPGASGRLQTVVTGGPGGEVSWWVTFADGRAVDAGTGSDDAPEPDAASVGGIPRVLVTMPHELAAAVAREEVDLSTAFMQGRAKVAGDQAALLRLLALTATPAYRAAVRAAQPAR